MQARKSIKIAGVIMSASLVLGALVAGSPADAKRAKKCKKFKAAEPVSDAETRDQAKKAKVVKITDKFTQKKPLKINYDHGPAFWFIADPVDAEGQRPAVEDTKWFNVQVDSKKKMVGLYVRQEWSATPVSDMDLYMYDKYGSQAASSGDFNQVQGTPLNSGTGGQGFEQVSGLGAKDCSGYTIESRAFTTPGEAMTLKIWLGKVQ
jgi:hypothetical protein